MVPENIHTPHTEGSIISSRVGDSMRQRNFKKKCMKLNWNFQRGGGGIDILELHY